MIHERNPRVLAFEIRNIAHDLVPTFMRDMMISLDIKNYIRSTCKVTMDENKIICSI